MYTPPLSNLTSTKGNNKGGIAYFLFCPIEWLAAEVSVDRVLRFVNTPVALLPGKTLLRATCLTDSMGFSEKQSVSKSGPFEEQKLVGVINKDELEKNLEMDTLKFHKHLVIYYDKNGQVKIIGNRSYGMDFGKTMEVEPTTAGKSFYQIELTHQTEHAAPFYRV